MSRSVLRGRFGLVQSDGAVAINSLDCEHVFENARHQMQDQGVDAKLSAIRGEQNEVGIVKGVVRISVEFESGLYVGECHGGGWRATHERTQALHIMSHPVSDY